MSVFLIKRIDQAKLLANAFKLSVLEQFVDEPRTAKQVADRMKVKQTRLYRHIDSLHEAGLLKIVKEQQKRGTVERYYQAVAKRFEIDAALFSNSKSEKNETIKLVKGLLRDTENELLPLLSEIDGDISDTGEINGISVEDLLLMRLVIEASDAQISALRKKLLEWLEECQELPSAGDGEATKSFRGLVVLYPHKGKQ